MHTRAVTALATTVAALLLSSAPAVADDWKGPEEALCERYMEFLETGFIVLPMKITASCVDPDDPRLRMTFD
ncbi:hypothetical protein ACIBI9_08905 [Nonomuraea sp. NPDC050451]|uniref:hypothetical protein n=1 Tax=Nonomuraea sp. NPDC050451 TaxID=3364364 RepID=UPI0037B36733